MDFSAFFSLPPSCVECHILACSLFSFWFTCSLVSLVFLACFSLSLFGSPLWWCCVFLFGILFHVFQFCLPGPHFRVPVHQASFWAMEIPEWHWHSVQSLPVLVFVSVSISCHGLVMSCDYFCLINHFCFIHLNSCNESPLFQSATRHDKSKLFVNQKKNCGLVSLLKKSRFSVSVHAVCVFGQHVDCRHLWLHAIGQPPSGKEISIGYPKLL